MAKISNSIIVWQKSAIQLFNPNKVQPQKSKDDDRFSLDVFIIDETGLNGLAYYSFEENKWEFHTDTLVYYFEEDDPTEWYWYYPPINIEDVKKADSSADNETHLTRLIWDAFLTAEMQDEQWQDQDTCKLIVQKILNNEPIKYAKGKLP